jgi:hypothetical protein
MRVYCASPYTSAGPAQAAENVAHALAVGRTVRALTTTNHETMSQFVSRVRACLYQDLF